MNDSVPSPDSSAKRRPPVIELLDPAVVEILRRKTPTERVAMIFEANRTMRLRLEGHLRTVHPDWDDEIIMREITRRMLNETDWSYLDAPGAQ